MDIKPQADEFVTLIDLLMKGTPVGVLAEAVELYGIEGWDRFGRLKSVKAQHELAVQALDALATVFAWYNLPERAGSISPVEDAQEHPESGSPLYFGWGVATKPDFDAIKEGLLLRQNVSRKISGQASGTLKGQRMDLLLVGALYKFIKGDFSTDSHPSFESKKSLANILDEKLDGAAGTADSLVKKLKRAEDDLDQKLLE